MTENRTLSEGERLYRRLTGTGDAPEPENRYDRMADTPLNRGSLAYSSMQGDQDARAKLAEWDAALASGLPADMNAPVADPVLPHLGTDPGAAAHAEVFGS